MAEDRYDGATKEGAGQNSLSTCGERTAEDKAGISIAGSESRVWRFRAPQPETPDIGESNPGGVSAIGSKTATDREESVAMDKSVNRKDDCTHLPTIDPETMTVGAECPSESLEEEGGSERPRIADVTIRGRNGQEPSEPIPENTTIGPLRPHKTEQMDDNIEESWHDTSKEGCEMAYEEVEEGARKRPDWGPNRTEFRIGWGVIRSWFVRPRPESA